MSEILTVNPSGYSSSNSSYSNVSSNYPISNAYANSSSTTYARLTCRTGSSASTYISYTFDLSNIPSNAIIESVTCIAKARVSSTSYLTSAYVQLYNNTIAKGSATSCFSTSTSATYTLTCGDWTREELDNLQLRVTTKRGTKNTTRSAYLYIYGADLTITYSTGVQHTITISANEGGTINPSGTITIDENDSFELEITPNVDYKIQSVTSNGAEVEVTEVTKRVLDNGICLVQNELKDELELSTVTTNGVTTSTVQNKFGGTSFYFDGSSYMQLALTEDTKPCTIEMWVYCTTDNIGDYYYPTIFSSASYGNAGGTYMHLDDGPYSTYPVCRANGNTSSTNNGSYGSTVITRNTWHHIAMCYDGTGNHYYFVDGVLQATVSQTSPNSYQNWYIGCLYGSNAPISGCYFEGYMDEILISNVCKWTSEFSVPTEEYSAVTKTYYSYSIASVVEDMVIVVTFGEDTVANILYIKNSNGEWKQVSQVFRKINNEWIEQTDLSSVFDINTNYMKGEV